MEILEAIILGIVQGITGWFPISSSGHLVIVQQVFNINADLMFDLVLHLGSLLVLLIYFWKDILKIVKAVVSWEKDSPDFKMGIYVLLGSIPIGFFGVLYHDAIERLFQSLIVVGIALIVTGTILYLTKFFNEKKKINTKKSIIVGIAQAVAMIPGISRSGLTISTGMFLGIEKKDIAKFSFLLAIPAIIGANIFEFSTKSSFEIMPLIIGFITSFIIGYISLKLLMKIITKGKFYYFAWYCWALGLILLVLQF